MGDEINSKLVKFIDKWRASKRPKVDHFRLLHAAAELSVLDTIPVDDDTPPTRELVQGIVDSAQSHAEAFGGTQRYVIAAMGDRTTVLGQEWLSCTVMNTVAGIGMADTEPPTTKGLMKLSFRYLDQAMKLAMSAIHDQQAQHEALRQSQQEELRLLRDQLANSTKKQLELVALTEEQISGKHQRDMEEAQFGIDESRKEWLFDLVKQYWPIMLSSLTGATPLAEFVGSLDEETKMQLLATVPEDKRERLQGLFAYALGAKKAVAELEQHHPGGGNGKS